MTESRKLSATDRRILRAVQADGRITNAALAEKVGMAPSPCLRRLKALEEDGIIAGYRGRIDRRALGHGVEAFVQVKLAQSDPDWRTTLIERIRRLTPVVACHALTGEYDLLIHAVAADLEAYGDFTIHELLTLPGVADVRSSFVIGTVKPDAGWPIPE